MADLQLTGVEKIYGSAVHAVKSINLAVPDGAFCVLVGPSGCGKSTLLRMVAGLERISAGEIRIGGRVVDALEPSERDIAMVFQNYALYPHMRVYDNIAYGLRNRGTPAAEIEARVAEAARILGLEQLLERRPRELSGGQRQRVAMGRAIVRKPKLFLFDEPLSNLDAKLRVQMRVEIRRLQKTLNTTALYVTHDQVEAMTMSDLLVVMNSGRVEQAGRPVEVYRRPASLFVAGFIGSPPMNILAGSLVGEGNIEIAGYLVPGLQLQRSTHNSRKLRVGVRPEHLVAVEGGIPADVIMVEELGATQITHARLGDQLLQLHAETGTFPDVGGRVYLGCKPGCWHLFDPETGLRIETGGA